MSNRTKVLVTAEEVRVGDFIGGIEVTAIKTDDHYGERALNFQMEKEGRFILIRDSEVEVER